MTGSLIELGFQRWLPVQEVTGRPFLTYLICSTSTILGTNGPNSADVPLSNKQTNRLADRGTAATTMLQ